MPDNNQAITKTDLDHALGAAVRQLTDYIDGRSHKLQTELVDYIDERTRDLQTELLRAFADYNHSAGIRFAKLEADTSNIDSSTTKRLGELERQMTDFRLRLIALEGHR